MLQVAGADRVVSVDLHSGQIQGFFDMPFDHLTATPVLVDYLRQPRHRGHGGRRPRRRPGEGGGALQPAPGLRPRLRPQAPAPGTANQVEALDVVGEVEGRHCVLIDDMIDTAGTICAAAELLAERGCRGRLGHGDPRRAAPTRPSTG